jgi:diguanylate cyclase (GGDEF)-like protein
LRLVQATRAAVQGLGRDADQIRVLAMRGWMIGVAGSAVIAASVLAASEQQRSTSETNFNEAQAGEEMQIAILSAERGLDAFLASGKPEALQTLVGARLQLTTSLVEARRLANDDVAEQRAVNGQADAFQDWNTLANRAIDLQQATGRGDSSGLERQRNVVIDDFLVDSRDYQARLLVNRVREERQAALLPVWLLLGFGALLATVAIVSGRRTRRAHARQATFGATQARFVEAIQFAEDEGEAHDLLTRHLETSVPGASVVVLNRNNSFDRLEATRQLPDTHPLSEPLLTSKPRSCLAVRLSRRYDRGRSELPEAFGCGICGALAGPSSCQPLLVGGEVIGAVLVAPEQPLDGETDARLVDSVGAAAPVLANLRNLAIAESRAATDVLTGLPNRRTVDDTLRRMLAHADRNFTSLSVALLDLDHFKQINDDFGHERGDDALAALAALLRTELRASDFAGRSGGEEFVFFLPDTVTHDALAIADKIRRGVQKLRIDGIDRGITASIGVATFPGDAASPEALMRAADRALYAAKKNGRDRVEVAAAGTHAAEPTVVG